MAYTILPASDGVTPYNAARDQHIQQGVSDAHDELALLEAVPDLVSSLAASGGYVWWRGGADVHPEHTGEAYELARDKGAEALEVSVQRAKDGSLWCLHDTGSSGLDRTTSLTGDIKDRYAPELGVRPIVDYGLTFLGGSVSASTGWNTPLALPTAARALDGLVGRVVVFLESKDGSTAATTALRELVSQYPEPEKSVVLKYFREADGEPPAYADAWTAAGFKHWPYMDAADADALIEEVAGYAGASGGFIGMPIEASDAKITVAVNTGTPVMVWPVRRRYERARLAALGVDLFMCSDPIYVSGASAARTTDAFHVGARIGGDLPCSDSWLPVYDGANGIVAIPAATTSGIVMGSMSPVAGASGTYRITGQVQWPTLPGDTSTHLDVFFGHDDDRPYTHQGAANAGGYHLVMRANGQFQLYRHDSGSTTGTQLATQTLTAPASGAWLAWQIDVTPTNVSVQRTDIGASALSVANTTYRGGYWGLSSGSSSTTGLWRDLVTS